MNNVLLTYLVLQLVSCSTPTLPAQTLEDKLRQVATEILMREYPHLTAEEILGKLGLVTTRCPPQRACFGAFVVFLEPPDEPMGLIVAEDGEYTLEPAQGSEQRRGPSVIYDPTSESGAPNKQ